MTITLHDAEIKEAVELLLKKNKFKMIGKPFINHKEFTGDQSAYTTLTVEVEPLVEDYLD